MAFTLALLRQWHLHFVLVHRTLLLTSLQFVVWEEGAAYLYWNGLDSLQNNIFCKFVGKSPILPMFCQDYCITNQIKIKATSPQFGQNLPYLYIFLFMGDPSCSLLAKNLSKRNKKSVRLRAFACLLACYSRRDMRGTHMASLVNLAM